MTDTYFADIEARLHAADLGAFTAHVCHLYSAVQAHAYVTIGRGRIIACDPAGVETAAVDIRPEWTVVSVVRQAMDMAGHTWEPAVTCDRCGQLVDPTHGHDEPSGPCAPGAGEFPVTDPAEQERLATPVPWIDRAPNGMLRLHDTTV